jgi:cytochrome c553
MKGMVSTLSDQDIEDIAAYFSSLPSKLDTLKGHVQGDN